MLGKHVKRRRLVSIVITIISLANKQPTIIFINIIFSIAVFFSLVLPLLLLLFYYYYVVDTSNFEFAKRYYMKLL